MGTFILLVILIFYGILMFALGIVTGAVAGTATLKQKEEQNDERK